MIYVDQPRWKYRGLNFCHLFSDSSLHELHVFADQLGLKREWFQDKQKPHYDITESVRARAIALGAQVADKKAYKRYFTHCKIRDKSVLSENSDKLFRLKEKDK